MQALTKFNVNFLSRSDVCLYYLTSFQRRYSVHETQGTGDRCGSADRWSFP